MRFYSIVTQPHNVNACIYQFKEENPSAQLHTCTASVYFETQMGGFEDIRHEGQTKALLLIGYTLPEDYIL